MVVESQPPPSSLEEAERGKQHSGLSDVHWDVVNDGFQFVTTGDLNPIPEFPIDDGNPTFALRDCLLIRASFSFEWLR